MSLITHLFTLLQYNSVNFTNLNRYSNISSKQVIEQEGMSFEYCRMIPVCSKLSSRNFSNTDGFSGFRLENLL